ncbi:MAG: 2'-5' RNA ligase family protein [Clostridiaceae bacterium]
MDLVYAVELYLDRACEKEIIKLVELMPTANLTGGFHFWKRAPHITLGMFTEIDEEKAEEKLKKLVRQWKRAQANFTTVGAFPDGVLFISPVMNEFIYTVHVDVHESFHYPKTGYERYSYGNWLPHLTLVEYKGNNETLLEAFKVLMENFSTLTGGFDRVALVKLDTSAMELCSFKLRD